MSTFVKATQAYQPGQRTLPRRYYVSSDVYGEEQERIFAQRWLCVGRQAELAEPGDYVLRTVAGESVIVVRGQDGAVRAFYNVCRHRGTRLCTAERGRLSETIQCPYHAWTYTLDGTLIGAPHMNEVPGFDKRDYPLHPVALAAWEGFLFINLARDPEPFAQAFAPLAGRFSRFNLASRRRPGGGGPAPRVLLLPLPEHAAVTASRLRHVPHALARGLRPDPHHLRVAVPSRRVRAAGLRARGRGELLGRDQPPGLEHLRALAARDRLTRLRAGAVLAARGHLGRVGSGISQGHRAHQLTAKAEARSTAAPRAWPALGAD